MNKLKKPRPNEAYESSASMSRTMQLAVAALKAPGDDASNVSSGRLQRRNTWFSAPLSATPSTKVEQYWAARALVAETLLSARDRHQDELARVRRTEEQKREREIGVILHVNDQRQRRLERMMVMCLVVLLGSVCWMVVKITPDRDHHHAKSKSNKPSHFTIPILSPFTSVVEHESGALGTTTVAIFVLVMGIAVYAVMRQWISQRRAG